MLSIGLSDARSEFTQTLAMFAETCSCTREVFPPSSAAPPGHPSPIRLLVNRAAQDKRGVRCGVVRSTRTVELPTGQIIPRVLMLRGVFIGGVMTYWYVLLVRAEVNAPLV